MKKNNMALTYQILIDIQPGTLFRAYMFYLEKSLPSKREGSKPLFGTTSRIMSHLNSRNKKKLNSSTLAKLDMKHLHRNQFALKFQD
jgi:hypothetical protein